ncbi:hypothetical protein [Bacillus sp. OK048]|uniref:hypothetical protein n=1 Tax=Bacillus sp. OK048 TaxID=1882761 RepID=UPI000885D5AF|nr:hypothetical protein [Bacillus sp. OK048]SDM17372.1 hypothetical protein SAMN05443253_102165 [Bacillus sp. OK048]
MPDKNDVIIINLDRPRVLRFGHRALKKMTAATGKDLDSIEVNGNDLDELEKIMFYGLLADAKEHNEDLKLEDMEDLLDRAPVWSEIMEKMQMALNAAFGQIEIDPNLQRVAAESKKTKKQSGTGKKA